MKKNGFVDYSFDTGKSSVPEAQTLEIAALVEAGAMALETPDQWGRGGMVAGRNGRSKALFRSPVA